MSSACVYTPSLWPSFFTFVYLLALSAYSWRRHSVAAAVPFAVGSFFAALWAAGSVMEFTAVTEATKIFWFKFQAVVHLPIPTAVICFLLEYAWPGRWLTRRNLILMSLPPLLYFMLALTNELHHFIWRGFVIDGVVTPLLGPGGWLFLSYSYVLAVVGIFVLLWLFARSPAHRTPVFVILIGMLGGRLLYLLDAATIVQSALPLDILAIAFAFLMYAIALFGFNLFDPVAMARQTAFEQLYVGIVILDPRERVMRMNPAVERMLDVTVEHAVGRPFTELCPGYAEANSTAASEAEFEVTIGNWPDVRYYTVAISPLKDWRGAPVARLLLLQDVTEQRRSQAQLVERQRTVAMLQERARLARELHDTLGQVCAFVNTQGQTICRLLDRGEIQEAHEYTMRMVEVTGTAHVDIREMILGLRASPLEHGLFWTMERFLAQYERTYGIHAEVDVPELLKQNAFAPHVEALLLRILQEAMTNVRKHAGTQEVVISFAAEGSSACMKIQDFGRGFEPAACPDSSGQHIGLRLMRERAEEAGGSLTLDSAPGQGTRIVVCVPTTAHEQDLEQALI